MPETENSPLLKGSSPESDLDTECKGRTTPSSSSNNNYKNIQNLASRDKPTESGRELHGVASAQAFVLGLESTKTTDSSGRLGSSSSGATSGLGFGFSNPTGSDCGFPGGRDRGLKQLWISWKNINVYAKDKDSRKGCWRRAVDRCRGRGTDTSGMEEYENIVGEKQILKNVSGYASPGKLLAILGASGSGKTTLLNVLTQRNLDGLDIVGRVKVNGVELGTKISTVSAYIQQSDLFIEVMTPREHLTFHAALVMGRDVPKIRQDMRVEEVIVELGLQNCADTKIGLPGQITGLSGGERKRLSFATKILTDPSLMLCDEPTSGLDSFMAETLVNCLRGLADQQRTIICTIHQPSSQVYAMFDNVMYIAEGRVAYFGTREGADEVFTRAGLSCPPRYNPADYYIHAMAVAPGQETECRAAISAVCRKYEASQQRASLENSLTMNELVKDSALLSKVELLSETKNPYKATMWTQLRYVLWRSWLTVSRDSTLTKTRLIQTFISALLFGIIYLNQTYDQKGVMNINGMLFLCITQMTFGSMSLVINTFPAEYPLFHRDHHDSTYTIIVYYLSKMIAEVPMFVGIPVLFTTTMYFMIGLYPTAEAFTINLLTNVLIGNIAVSYGYLLSSLTTNVNLILTVSPLLTTVLLTFGGLFVNAASIPVYLIWLKYISWFSYGYEILVINQWKNVDHIQCEAVKEFLENTTTTGAMSSGKCFNNGKEVIASFGYTEGNMVFDFVMLVALLIAFRIVSFLVLYLRTRRRRN